MLRPLSSRIAAFNPRALHTLRTAQVGAQPAAPGRETQIDKALATFDIKRGDVLPATFPKLPSTSCLSSEVACPFTL
jgi:hypothetical protein